MTYPVSLQEQAVAAYVDGVPVAEICHRLRVTPPTVLKWVRARYLPLRFPTRGRGQRSGRPPKIGRLELGELRARGLTDAQLAAHFGVQVTGIQAARRRWGLS